MTAVHLCQYRRHEDLLEEASIEGWHLNNVVWVSKESIEELLREIPPSPFASGKRRVGLSHLRLLIYIFAHLRLCEAVSPTSSSFISCLPSSAGNLQRL